MIDQTFKDTAARYAGKETPAAFSELIDGAPAFMLTLDLTRTALFPRLGSKHTAPHAFDFYQLTAYRETLFKLHLAALNMAYLCTLADVYKRPLADLHTVELDQKNDFQAARRLLEKFEITGAAFRERLNTPGGHQTAADLFFQITAEPLPADPIDGAAALYCWNGFFMADGLHRLPDEWLNRITAAALERTGEAADMKKQWFEKIMTALDRRNLKAGKKKDYGGFIAAVMDLERRGLPVTKTWNGRRLFCAKKIFRELTNHHTKHLTARERREVSGDILIFNVLCRNNPLKIQAGNQTFHVFIEKTADDIAILQWDGDFDEIRLKIESFQNHILKRMTPR